MERPILFSGAMVRAILDGRGRRRRGGFSMQWRCYRPSIHMPHWACRLELEIAGVRVEWLQNITDTDSIFEGIGGNGHEDAWTD